MENSYAKLTCGKCGSRFLLTLVRDKDAPNRQFNDHVDVLHVSDMAKAVLKAKMEEKAKAKLDAP